MNTKKYKIFIEDDREFIFVTLTYKRDPLIGIRTQESLLDQFTSTVYEITEYLDQCSDYIFVPEYTLSGRIHYHILLKINNKCKTKYYQMISKLKRNGYVSASYVRNVAAVLEYLCKDIDELSPLLGVELPLGNPLPGCKPCPVGKSGFLLPCII